MGERLGKSSYNKVYRLEEGVRKYTSETKDTLEQALREIKLKGNSSVCGGLLNELDDIASIHLGNMKKEDRERRSHVIGGLAALVGKENIVKLYEAWISQEQVRNAQAEL